jgi:Spy/CpxP family protein refolding chaperone
MALQPAGGGFELPPGQGVLVRLGLVRGPQSISPQENRKMRRSGWWTSALVALLLLLSPVATDWAAAAPGAEGRGKKARKKGARDRKARQPKKRGPGGYYGIMMKVLEMDEAQKAKLMQAVQDSQKALKDWTAGPSGTKYKELTEARKQAAKDKDKEKVKSISQQLRELQKERAEIQAAQRAAVLDILTPQQKATWAGHELYTSVMRRYKRVDLADDQKAKLKELCTAKAATMPAASDRRARGQALKKLYEEIDGNILTDEQREALKRKPEKKAREPREKKARAKKGGKKGGAAPIIVD